MRLNLLLDRLGIPTVCPHVLESGKAALQWCQQACDPMAIQDIGSVHADCKYQSLCIDQEMLFSVIGFFAPIEAAHTTNTRRYDRLAIDHDSTGLGITTRRYMYSTS